MPKTVFDSDILTLFPNAAPSPERDHAEKSIAKYISNRIVVLVAGDDIQQIKSATEDYAKGLESSLYVAQVIHEHTPEDIEALAGFYREHAGSLLSTQDKTAIKTDSQALVQKVLFQIFTHPAQLSSNAFVQDPLGFSDNYLKQATSNLAKEMDIEQGLLVANYQGKYYALVQVLLAESSFSISSQDAIYHVLMQEKQRLLDHYPELNILSTGTFFFSLSGATQAKKEISTVGLGSILGIVLLLIFVFRSLPVLFSALIPAVVGVLAGMLCVSLVYNQIHLVTMVFGVSLIGVSIDYSFHFLTTRLSLGEQWVAQNGLGRIFSGLTMGLITSASAYLCFVFSGFPGLKQIALFSSTGLIAAYLTVIGLFPVLFRSKSQPLESIPLLVSIFGYLKAYSAFWINIKAKRTLLFGCVLTVLTLFAVSLHYLQINDDIRAMQSLDPGLLSEAIEINTITQENSGRRYYLVSGNDEADLIQRLQQLTANTAGLDATLQSPANWIETEGQQKANQQLVYDALVRSGQLPMFLDQLGVKPDVKETIVERYTPSSERLITLAEAYPKINRVIDFPSLFELDGRMHAIVLVNSTLPSDAFAAAAQSMDQVIWVDTVSEMNLLLENYRIRSMILLCVAYLLVLVLLVVRYGFRGAASTVCPPLLGTAIATVILTLIGSGISIFHLMAMLLVLGIGIDYTIFLRESKNEPEETLFAISLSVLTTILAFGLLSLSETEAIHGFGFTLLIGIVVCFICAPLAIKTQN
ncbi:MMPL family transporter [Teredinibacter sp. KSP-S5-2]|uniref:MMPL family transporter n=1 Tax=Teredinibacter sp. KSP-S5-2 TaxID=3034506 RepID=UPI00293447FD|nr:MMPL family transporter [Teredinibacter sp. KSP-S5-2]WNO09248.1 MMPL family transporter [Teredinibacter sp. KSP-S5-2]